MKKEVWLRVGQRWDNTDYWVINEVITMYYDDDSDYDYDDYEYDEEE